MDAVDTPKKNPPTQKREARGLYQNDQGKWVADWYEGKKRKRKVVGFDKKEAQRYLKTQKERARLVQLMPERFATKVEAPSITVADLVERFNPELLANCRSVKNPIISGRVLAEFFGATPIQDIKPTDIERFKSHRLATQVGRKYKDEKKHAARKTLSPATVNRDLARLKTLLGKAVTNGLLGVNPMASGKVKLLAEENVRYEYLSDEQERQLRNQITKPKDWQLVEFAFLTGLRARNQFNLRRSNCDMAGRILIFATTKGKKVKIFHLGPRAHQLLETILASHTSEWVFPSRDPAKPKSHINFYNKVYRPALLAAGLSNYTWHTLRHTYGSRCAMAGMDINTLKEQMFHSSVRVTERYMHHSPNHVKKMVQLYG